MGRYGRDDGRERPSWRELDRRREHPEERTSRSRARIERPGSGYQSYKDKLGRLFDSGGLGQLVDDDQAEAALSADDMGERARLVRELRQAAEGKPRFQALDALLAAGEALPDDTELLASCIDHPKEPVQRQILEHMIQIIERQPLKRNASFKMRLETLQITASDRATLSAVDRLLEKL